MEEVMVLNIILCILAVAFGTWAIRDHWKSVKEAKAIDLHLDFSEKIDELIEDPFTFDSDWKKLIPVLAYIDILVDRDMVCAKFGSLAERARRQAYGYNEEIGV